MPLQYLTEVQFYKYIYDEELSLSGLLFDLFSSCQVFYACFDGIYWWNIDETDIM